MPVTISPYSGILRRSIPKYILLINDCVLKRTQNNVFGDQYSRTNAQPINAHLFLLVDGFGASRYEGIK